MFRTPTISQVVNNARYPVQSLPAAGAFPALFPHQKSLVARVKLDRSHLAIATSRHKHRRERG